MRTPRIEINLSKIAYNVKKIVQLYSSKGISVIGVTKGVCGEPMIANTFLKNGIDILGDSRIANLQRMRNAGIQCPFLLLRLPSISEIDYVVKYADMSLNSEIGVINKISENAIKNNTKHKIILMIELGDLREGILPSDLEYTVKEVLKLKGVKIAGIGTNLGCFGGVVPDDKNMNYLSSLARDIENKFEISMEFISGGNSANYNWVKSTKDVGEINNVRLGELLLVGRNSLDDNKIHGLYSDAFTLIAEVIESKVKCSIPYGKIGFDAFGNSPKFEDRGQIKRIILGIGRQDIMHSALIPRLDIDILGASSDHLILDAKDKNFNVGDEVAFDVKYGAMLSAMSSPYIFKKYINE